MKYKVAHCIQLVLLAVILVGLTVPGAKAQTKSDSLLVNADIKQLQQVIGSYEGKKAVLVNIWATWCGPCVEEFPYVVKLQKKYPKRLKVLFVSADFETQRDRAVQFLKEQGVSWTTYFKTGDDQAFINGLEPEWSGSLPFTKVIGVDGREVAHWESKADFSTFERYAKQAMEE